MSWFGTEFCDRLEPDLNLTVQRTWRPFVLGTAADIPAIVSKIVGFRWSSSEPFAAKNRQGPGSHLSSGPPSGGPGSTEHVAHSVRGTSRRLELFAACRLKGSRRAPAHSSAPTVGSLFHFSSSDAVEAEARGRDQRCDIRLRFIRLRFIRLASDGFRRAQAFVVAKRFHAERSNVKSWPARCGTPRSKIGSALIGPEETISWNCRRKLPRSSAAPRRCS